jgi:transketolase C-terminal domain/subunit
MSKYLVITPLSRSTKDGFETFTHGDLIELDEKDATRMIAAGIVTPVETAEPLEEAKELRTEEIETADVKPAGVEKAVKRSRKEK